MGFAGVTGDAAPPLWESRLMQTAVHASIRRRAAVLQPLPTTDETLVAGGKLYVAGCAGCHGDIGKPGADRDHYPRVPQFAAGRSDYSDKEMYWVVKHGIRMTAMSAYGPFYTDEKMWAIAGFLQRIQNLPPELVVRIQAK
jgi:mono/diheme cytochrome c family protein